MHGSLHIVLATETNRMRQADGHRARSRSARPTGLSAMLARLLPNRAPAQAFPSRAAPGTDARSLGHPSAAPLRGR